MDSGKDWTHFLETKRSKMVFIKGHLHNVSNKAMYKAFYGCSSELHKQSQLVVNNSLPCLQNIITEKVESLKKLCDNMPSYFQINLNNFSELMIKLKIIYLTLNDSHPAI